MQSDVNTVIRFVKIETFIQLKFKTLSVFLEIVTFSLGRPIRGTKDLFSVYV